MAPAFILKNLYRKNPNIKPFRNLFKRNVMNSMYEFGKKSQWYSYNNLEFLRFYAQNNNLNLTNYDILTKETIFNYKKNFLVLKLKEKITTKVLEIEIDVPKYYKLKNYDINNNSYSIDEQINTIEIIMKKNNNEIFENDFF